MTDNPTPNDIALLREALIWIDSHADDQDMNHVNFRIGAGSRARAALAPVQPTAPTDKEAGEGPAGMVLWHGGDSAPSDWDGDSFCHRDGQVLAGREAKRWASLIGNLMWVHDEIEAPGDIIAYTPKPATPPQNVDAGEVGPQFHLGDHVEKVSGSSASSPCSRTQARAAASGTTPFPQCRSRSILPATP